jgi:signal peptidase I
MKQFVFVIGMCLILVACQQKEKTIVIETITDTTTLENVPVVDSVGYSEIEYLYDGMYRGHHEYAGTLVIDKDYYSKNNFQRGEVVFFKTPKTGHKNVARVVGLPGEKLEIIDGQLYINNKKLKAFYAKAMNNGISDFHTYQKLMKANGNEIKGEKDWKEYFYRNLKSVVIPKNEVFILADNGWRIQDSYEFGPISQDDIEGKVLGMAEDY